MEIWIQIGKIVTRDKDGWKHVCVAVIGLNGLWKTEEKEEYATYTFVFKSIFFFFESVKQ